MYNTIAMMRKIVRYLAGATVIAGVVSPLLAYCPSGCTPITSGPVTFCRCMIYETSNPNDRVQLVTDRTYSMLDVNGDGLVDIPFGVYLNGANGSYVLQNLDGGIPGTYSQVRISNAVGYGITPIGDINGDGIEDFAVASRDLNGDVDILLSPGTFPAIYSKNMIYLARLPNSIIGHGGYIWWSDYDGSINMYDIATITHYRRNDSLCGDGIAFGDFNNDGYIDAACSNYIPGSQGLYIYYFDGSSFSSPFVLDNTRPWQGIVAYDINRDGRTDIISVGTQVSVWLNNGYSWTEVPVDPSLAVMNGGYPPFTRVALAGIGCDTLIDIVVSTACPDDGEPLLVWYENLGDATAWAKHPIEYTGNYCFTRSTRHVYPYGLRVGFLDNGDGIDVVIVRDAPNQLWGYFTDTCGVAAWDSSEAVHEHLNPTGTSLDISPMKDGLVLKSPNPVAVSIYNLQGAKVYESVIQGERAVPLKKGIYFVRTPEKAYKVLVRDL